jgi:GT2 family glycosyltransferase
VRRILIVSRADDRFSMSVKAVGKSFSLGDSPFRFRGVELSASLSSAQLDTTLAEIAAAGLTVVSTSEPSADACAAAARHGLRLLVRYDDLWESVAVSRLERRSAVHRHETRLRALVRGWRGVDAPLAIAFAAPSASEVSPSEPAVCRIANRLARCVRDANPLLLTAWRAGGPLDERCPEDVDFLIVDLPTTSMDDLPAKLMACHRRVGDRPLVLGSAPAAADAAGQAAVLETAIDRGAAGSIVHGWPIDASAAAASRITVRDLERAWPRISVIISAYNAEATLEECLSHCEKLEYPELEVLVVDDGSTDSTPSLAASHKGTRLVSITHGGLSAARNAGFRAATGDLVAYLDADAYPAPDWPWYLALAALRDGAGAAGGPNLPPPHDPPSAHVAALSPGGPVPLLRDEQSAAHLPGCNLAVWKNVVEELRGFDPALWVAADDVEFERRLLESGREMSYHPAALVWHHRRPGLRTYLRQQRNYGRSQAILEYRWPERFPSGFKTKVAARLPPRAGARAASVTVDYLLLPQRQSALGEVAHQWGMPAAVTLACTAPLGLADRRLLTPAAAALAYVAALFCFDVVTTGTGRSRAQRTGGFRVRLAVFRIFRPLAFRWGYASGRWKVRTSPPDYPPRPAAVAGPDGSPAQPGLHA